MFWLHNTVQKSLAQSIPLCCRGWLGEHGGIAQTISREKWNVPLLQLSPITGWVLALRTLWGRRSPVAGHLVQRQGETLICLQTVLLLPLHPKVFDEVRLDPHLLVVTEGQGSSGVSTNDLKRKVQCSLASYQSCQWPSLGSENTLKEKESCCGTSCPTPRRTPRSLSYCSSCTSPPQSVWWRCAVRGSPTLSTPPSRRGWLRGRRGRPQTRTSLSCPWRTWSWKWVIRIISYSRCRVGFDGVVS